MREGLTGENELVDTEVLKVDGMLDEGDKELMELIGLADAAGQLDGERTGLLLFEATIEDCEEVGAIVACGILLLAGVVSKVGRVVVRFVGTGLGAIDKLGTNVGDFNVVEKEGLREGRVLLGNWVGVTVVKFGIVRNDGIDCEGAIETITVGFKGLLDVRDGI